jgi:hypothetical protein
VRNRLKLIFTAAIQFAIVIAAAQVINAQIYGGRAIGITASKTANGSNTDYVAADTGALPAAGGDLTASSPSFSIRKLLSARNVTASTSGALRSTQSLAVVNDFVFTLDGVTVRADQITARTVCICCPGADLAACSSSTQIKNLVITDAAGNQTNVNVTGQAGQQVLLPGGLGTIFINEQSSGFGDITVTGLRIVASSGGSSYTVTAARATSTLECLTTGATAAPVTVSGRVSNLSGQGISGATISLMDGNGNVHSSVSDSLGYFTIAEVPSGESYILSVSHPTYSFSRQMINVNGDLTVNVTSN